MGITEMTLFDLLGIGKQIDVGQSLPPDWIRCREPAFRGWSFGDVWPRHWKYAYRFAGLEKYTCGHFPSSLMID